MVVGVAELAVGGPDVHGLPVEEGVGVVDVVAQLGGPAVVVVHLVLAGQVYAAPSVEALLGAYADEVAGAGGVLLLVEPLGEVHLELIVPHLGGVEGEILAGHAPFGHLPDPDVPHLLVPGAPVALVHRGAGGHAEGHADAVDLEDVLVVLQDAVHVLDSVVVLYLVVHVEDAELAFGAVAADVVHAEVQQHAAVLASGEGYAHVVELPEDDVQALHGQLVDVLAVAVTLIHAGAPFSCVCSVSTPSPR